MLAGELLRYTGFSRTGSSPFVFLGHRGSGWASCPIKLKTWCRRCWRRLLQAGSQHKTRCSTRTSARFLLPSGTWETVSDSCARSRYYMSDANTSQHKLPQSSAPPDGVGHRGTEFSSVFLVLLYRCLNLCDISTKSFQIRYWTKM